MENNQNRDVIEIDLRQMLLALWGRIWLILLSAVLAAALALGYAVFCIAPTYSASTQLYVNNNYESPGFSSSQLTAAQSLAATYMVILESRAVLGEVAEQTGLGYSYGQLKGMVSATAVNETEVFEVTVVCQNYQHAAAIANSIAQILPDQISAVVYGSSVSVVDYAVENSNPVGPGYRNYFFVGAVVGMLLSAAVVVVAELFDTSIHSEEYLSQVYGEIPLLAVVPGAESVKSGYKGYYEAAHSSRPGKKTGGAK